LVTGKELKKEQQRKIIDFHDYDWFGETIEQSYQASTALKLSSNKKM
jgi:hypothetical protein